MIEKRLPLKNVHMHTQFQLSSPEVSNDFTYILVLYLNIFNLCVGTVVGISISRID